MKIQVGQIEGKSKRKGTKQNRIYNCTPDKVKGFYKTDCGRTLWNVNGDWSLLGVMVHRRCTYTKDFKIIN